jgi:four helix bundle protein
MEEHAKQMSFFRFDDLRVYHKSLDYFKWLTEQVNDFSDFDKKILVKSLLNAAIRISVNIAEGSARHKQQFVIFLKDAKTALRECVVLSTMIYQKGLFSEEQHEACNEHLVELTKMLGAMVVSLQRSSSRDSNRPESQPETDYPQQPDIDFEY